MLMSTPYHEFALLLLVSAAVGLLALRLAQPLIIAYVVVGVLVGPAVLGWVSPNDNIDLLAQIGISVLLFAVGLKLDVNLVRNLGPVALATGLGQLGFTIVIGFALAMTLGMGSLEALYVAIALTFSSTIIIVKLLSDKREIDSLHGRIAMGFLIVQDVAVVLAMLVMGTTGGGGEASWYLGLAIVAGKVAVATGAIVLLMRYVLPHILHWAARSQELLLLFAVAWGTSLATIGDAAGFSKEVGAFLAGFSLASSPYREAMSSRLTSVRDFLLLFFFIDLGAKLDLSTIGASIPAAITLSLFVLIGNPLIVMAIMAYMGYRKRTGFLAGLTVAQISEFSMVFVAMGIALGHVGEQTLGLVTLVGVTTITLSTYMILYSHELYQRMEPWLGAFERRVAFREARADPADIFLVSPQIVLFGIGRLGHHLGRALTERGLAVLGVDFDPDLIRRAERVSFPLRFGDAEDLEFVASLPLARAQWVISAMPSAHANVTLVRYLRHHGFGGRIAIVARSDEDAQVLSEAAPDRILTPFVDAAEFAATALHRTDRIDEIAD